MPIMARRPLLTSASSAFSLRSGVILLVKPKGSHRSAGPPAAEMSAKEIAGSDDAGPTPPKGPWMFHGKQIPLDCTQ